MSIMSSETNDLLTTVPVLRAILDYIKSTGDTLKIVAKLLGCSHVTLHRALKGHCKVKDDVLVRWAQKLDGYVKVNGVLKTVTSIEDLKENIDPFYKGYDIRWTAKMAAKRRVAASYIVTFVRNVARDLGESPIDVLTNLLGSREPSKNGNILDSFTKMLAMLSSLGYTYASLDKEVRSALKAQIRGA